MGAKKKKKKKATAKSTKASSRSSTIDPLFAEVLANPSDAALRQVWADQLIERGDPRGELIAIQVAAGDNPLTPAQDKRMRSLIFEHREEWLGDLSPIVQHREGLIFDRGVLDACQIQVKDVGAFHCAIGHPYWSTMRSIWLCDRFAWDPRTAALLTDPVCKRLEEVWVVGANSLFPLLANHPMPLPIKSIWTIDETYASGPLQALRDLPGLPHLKRLGMTSYAEVEEVLARPVLDHIETFGITSAGNTKTNDWLDQTRDRANLKTIEVRRHWIPIQGPTRSHWVLRFHRSPKNQAWSTLTVTPSGRCDVRQITEDLESVPSKSIERIEIQDESIRPLLKRFKRAEIVVNDQLRSH